MVEDTEVVHSLSLRVPPRLARYVSSTGECSHNRVDNLVNLSGLADPFVVLCDGSDKTRGPPFTVISSTDKCWVDKLVEEDTEVLCRSLHIGRGVVDLGRSAFLFAPQQKSTSM